MKRFVSIWFPYLQSDWLKKKHPEWQNKPIVIYSSPQGRQTITAVSPEAEKAGIRPGLALVDARIHLPDLLPVPEQSLHMGDLWLKMAEYFIRFSPYVSLDPPDGILMDATGCPHLWGGELPYLEYIQAKARHSGYRVRLAMAGTIGAAWAHARYGEENYIVAAGQESNSLLMLPPQALRLQEGEDGKLRTLGLHCIHDLLRLPIRSLQRRFGESLIRRIRQATGQEQELLVPHFPAQPFQERFQALDPIHTRKGIEQVLDHLLKLITRQLVKEEKGIRCAQFALYKTDGSQQAVSISLSHPSHAEKQLRKLFELKLEELNPKPGVDLFLLTILEQEELRADQEKIWTTETNEKNELVLDLIDRIMNKLGADKLRRYLPAPYHWPERSVFVSKDWQQEPEHSWTDKRRPIWIWNPPVPISVTAPVPDYPPMLFRYQGGIHKIIKADGPERIEREWWIADGQHRDYYLVEDESGCRYWLFRLGHYQETEAAKWFLHGIFA